MKIKPILFALLVGVILSSCSMVKNQTASNNFRRVKYNAHLKLNKTVEKKQLTVNSFEQPEKQSSNIAETTNENREIRVKKQDRAEKEEVERIDPKDFYIAENRVLEVAPLVAQKSPLQVNSAPKKQHILQNAVELTQNLSSKSTITTDDWWESDPEDWPWKEIILALIAFLLIALIVFLLVDLFGGVVGGIVGLILLLLLLYFLIDYLS
jgi:lipopolysaccharide export LptBFGC system permease protein LptF